MESEPEAWVISSERSARPEDAAVVQDGLHRFNLMATGLHEHHDVTFLVRDGTGSIKGGLLGYVWGGWLHITYLWVAEDCRRRGLGGRLLEKAEHEATSEGVGGAFLSTFDFQAPDFYRRHGYEVYGELRDCPPGHTHYHLRKLFARC
jgi:ribosomal protein S18 acetylase RimI-like enzyme